MTHIHADNFYNRFQTNVGAQRLDEYYQLGELKLDLVRLSVHEFQLTCRRTQQHIPPKIECLPLDVLRLIAAFVTYRRRAVLTFTCLNAYPFIPPAWELKSGTDNNALEEAVFFHNYEYSVPGNWCMQSMESDILQMLLRIMPSF